MYKINGSNYFKLRDLGKAPDLNAGWSKGKVMYIEGSKSYTEAD